MNFYRGVYGSVWDPCQLSNVDSDANTKVSQEASEHKGNTFCNNLILNKNFVKEIKEYFFVPCISNEACTLKGSK